MSRDPLQHIIIDHGDGNVSYFTRETIAGAQRKALIELERASEDTTVYVVPIGKRLWVSQETRRIVVDDFKETVDL